MATRGPRIKRQLVATALALAAVTTLTTAKSTKTNGSVNTRYPVAATFRCNGGDATCGDAIQGDGYAWPNAAWPTGVYVGSTTEQDGAYLDGGFNFYFPLPQAPVAPDVYRTIAFDFTSGGQTFPLGSFNLAPTYLSYPALVKAVDATNALLPNGFYSIPVASSAPARVKFDFPDPSNPSAYFYTLRWAGGTASGSKSSLATVARTASNTWVIEAGTTLDPVTGQPTELALLQRTNISGRQVTQNVGSYNMPFQITVQCGGSAATPCPR